MLGGEYRHALDQKNRIFTPAKLREELGSSFVVSKALRDKCLKVYSNQDTVVLYVNGKEVGQQTAHRVVKFNVALEEGFNTILAVAGDVKDSITLEKVEKEPDCYTLPEFNERQEGVANWFKQVGSLDLKAPMEFPEGYYSIKDSMEDLSKNEEALALATRAVKLATNFDI